MKIKFVATGIFAVFLFMGLNVSQQTTENGITTNMGFMPAAIADEDKDKASSAPLICKAADEAGGDAKDAKDKADKSEKEAKDSEDKADKDKADIDADKDASDKDKKDAKDKADKADKDDKDAKDKADKADKDYEDTKKEATDKAPCTTPDGKPGFLTPDDGKDAPTSGKPTPEAFRELHGN
ncbi:MAG: hypothetical protein Q9M08_03785 [Mariprofundus sp.]|nr:hypothetical protein [Mariprofundus sp.]